ncbi:MAG: hypothetical protein JNJ77_16620 [Planctomycetia bacterium]|nr:hypothetical protein [Planctomycetia bacterium]
MTGIANYSKITRIAKHYKAGRIVRFGVVVKVATCHARPADVLKYMSSVLGRMVKFLKRLKGHQRPPGIRGAVMTSTLRYGNDGFWHIRFRGVGIQDFEGNKYTPYNVNSALLLSARHTCGKVIPRPVDKFCHQVDVERKTVNRTFLKAVAWAARFQDISAAPPNVLLSILRRKTKYRLTRRFGVCHRRFNKINPNLKALKQAFEMEAEYRKFVENLTHEQSVCSAEAGAPADCATGEEQGSREEQG